MTTEHEYKERVVPSMSAYALRVGEGRISGYLSSFLGVMSFLAVLCFRYPSYLTTADLRAVYDVDTLRQVLRVSMWAALGFGLFTFVRGKRRHMGAIGIGFTSVAFALGGYTVETGPLSQRPISLGLDWVLLDLLGMAVLFIFIEKTFPRYRQQAILRPEWQLDLTYFSVNHLLVGVVLLVGNHFAPRAFGWAVNADLQSAVRALPVAAQLVVLLVCADLVQYWIHRLFHVVPWLWRFHAVHHSVHDMDWLAGSRMHVLEMFASRALIMVPLYLIGADKDALDLYVVFAALQTVFIHANVGIPTGPLKYVLATPQYHHWHHGSERPAIDTNFAVHLPVIDMIFGTFHLPAAHWPAVYGTTEQLPRSFWGQLLHPFVRR